MERLVIPEGGGYPPVFAYVGETKGLRENGLHQGETKELARAEAKKKQKDEEKVVWDLDREGFSGEHTQVYAETSQPIISQESYLVNN